MVVKIVGTSKRNDRKERKDARRGEPHSGTGGGESKGIGRREEEKKG